MARVSRVVVPRLPHHVTQRGNQQQDVFTGDQERRMYLQLLRKCSLAHELTLLGYCLMSNHVHLLVVPQHGNSLARGLGRTHADYARWVHVRRGTTGHLWQNRFFSCPLDDPHLWRTLRYVECNPVRAALVRRADHWPWSSVQAHLAGQDHTGLLDMGAWGAAFTPHEWRQVLDSGEDQEENQQLRRSTRTGRPFGRPEFVEQVEASVGRTLRLRPPGRKAAKPLPGQLLLAWE